MSASSLEEKLRAAKLTQAVDGHGDVTIYPGG